MDNSLDHNPVMLNEMLKYLAPQDGEIFLDTTFGAGGYSKAILDSCNCNIVSIDKDPTVALYVEKLSKEYNNRFKFIQSDFAQIPEKCGIDIKFDGIVMDLGVSSMQLDEGTRGFSFAKDGPLDMRMSNTGFSAADFINSEAEEEIANVIYRYGDETFSRRIAKRIVEERKIEPIISTLRLANIVCSSIFGKRGKIHPATKTFQAIRIHVNDELGQIERFLSNVRRILAPNGRLVIVTFHSLEDSIIKKFFQENSVKIVARSKYSKEKQIIEEWQWLKILTKKAVIPSRDEIKLNPRSRSAKLRASIRLGDCYV